MCHALFPEKGFVRPGYTIIMGDSHTCTHGAFGAFAAGVGTTDLEVGILKGVCAFRYPSTIKINITGNLPAGVYAKDVILSIIGRLGVNGATDKVIEFHGPVVGAMSMEARMTLCNMAVEAGATCGICPPDMTTVNYLWPFIKDEFASPQAALEAYARFAPDADAGYERIITHDISTLAPQVTFGLQTGPRQTGGRHGRHADRPGLYRFMHQRPHRRLARGGPGAAGRRIHPRVRGIVSPATPQIFSQALEEGIINIFMEAGFCVTNPTCGACLGMSNGVLAEGEVCASTTNRNFNGRMGKGGMVHLMSPATAAASALAGSIANSELYKG